jgi:hypothetical protein
VTIGPELMLAADDPRCGARALDEANRRGQAGLGQLDPAQLDQRVPSQ